MLSVGVAACFYTLSSLLENDYTNKATELKTLPLNNKNQTT